MIDPETIGQVGGLQTISEALALTPHLVAVQAERIYGQFPAQADISYGPDRKPDHVVVHYDNATTSYFATEYAREPLAEHDIRDLYIKAGVASAVIRDFVDPRDTRKLETIHGALTQPDSLLRSVFDASQDDFLSEKESGFILEAIRSGSICTDLATVNAQRLALAILCLVDPGTQSVVDLLTERMQDELHDVLISKDKFIAVQTAFGGNLLEANSNFANSIPLIVMVGAFPMGNDEAGCLLRTYLEK